MREERGTVGGDVLVFEPYTLWGSIAGKVRVIERGKFYVRGTIYGDLTLEYGGRCHIFGRIAGTVTVQRGAKLVHSGVIVGDLINDGGRIHIDRGAQVSGKIKTRKGETQHADQQPKLGEAPKVKDFKEIIVDDEGRKRYEL
jgi:predicted acyltransferase (DUF342 family)